MKPTHDNSAEEAFDQWLVLRAQEGDSRALERLVERWGPRVQRQAMRLTGRADAAADVAQEAWLAIVRGLRGLDDPACFRRWAYQIVTRRCADWVRKQQRQRAHSEPYHDELGAVEDPPVADERIVVLRNALQRLETKDRTILAMHYLDAMALVEIAESLGVPVGTVKSRLHHARLRLKRVLEAKLYE